MRKGYDFDIVRVGDRVQYWHKTNGDRQLVGTVTEVKAAADYDYVVHVECETSPDFTVRKYDHNIGADCYSVYLLDWGLDP